MLKKAMGDRRELERSSRLLEKNWREFKRNNSRRRVGKGEDTEAAVLEEE